MRKFTVVCSTQPMSTKTKKKVTFRNTTEIKSISGTNSRSPFFAHVDVHAVTPHGKTLKTELMQSRSDDFRSFVRDYAIHTGIDYDAPLFIRNIVTVRRCVEEIEKEAIKEHLIGDHPVFVNIHRYEFFASYYPRHKYHNIFETMFWTKKYYDQWKSGKYNPVLLKMRMKDAMRNPQLLADITHAHQKAQKSKRK